MSDPQATRTIRVTNPEGVHARAATLIAELARRFQSRVALLKGCTRVDGTEVLQLLSLGAAEGEEVTVEATGPDADAAVDALTELFAGNFQDAAPSSPPEQT
jgi:phosphotransferase system HPr (HPr) family protein